MDEEVLVKLAERVSPEGAALLLALHGREDVVVNTAAKAGALGQTEREAVRVHVDSLESTIRGQREEIANCHRVLDEQLGKETEGMPLNTRVLAAALGARQWLQHEPCKSKGWTYPKKGDKLRLVKIPPPEVCPLSGEDKWEIGMSLEVPTTDWVYGGYVVPGTGEEGPTVRASSAFLKSCGCLYIPFDCVEPA